MDVAVEEAESMVVSVVDGLVLEDSEMIFPSTENAPEREAASRTANLNSFLFISGATFFLSFFTVVPSGEVRSRACVIFLLKSDMV